jgi:hypothetical protein
MWLVVRYSSGLCKHSQKTNVGYLPLECTKTLSTTVTTTQYHMSNTQHSITCPTHNTVSHVNNITTTSTLSVIQSQLFIFSGLCIQTSVTVCGSALALLGEVCGVSCVRVKCVVRLVSG